MKRYNLKGNQTAHITKCSTMSWGCSSVGEYLPNMQNPMGSNPSTKLTLIIWEI